MTRTAIARIGVAFGLASSAWLTAWLLERSGFNRDFSRAKDVPALAAGATFAISTFTASVWASTSAPLRNSTNCKASSRSGLGMRTMRFRASAIGGRLLVSWVANGGNSLVCEAQTKTVFAATA